jgi:hypothetical protein
MLMDGFEKCLSHEKCKMAIGTPAEIIEMINQGAYDNV